MAQYSTLALMSCPLTRISHAHSCFFYQLQKPSYWIPAPEEAKPATLDESTSSQSNSEALIEIESQTEEFTCKPGEKAELFVKTSTTDCTYQWYFKDEAITTANADYEGSTASVLRIENCLSKHEGTYKCVVTDPAGKSVSSKEASVKIST